MLNGLDITNCIACIMFNIYVVKENVNININEIKPYLISWVNGCNTLSHVLIFITALIMNNYNKQPDIIA